MGNYQLKVSFLQDAMCEDPVGRRASGFEPHPEDLWTLLYAGSESVVLGGVGVDLRFCVSVKLSDGADVAGPWTHSGNSKSAILPCRLKTVSNKAPSHLPSWCSDPCATTPTPTCGKRTY